MKIIRWKAIVPLLLFLAVLVALYVLFADNFVRRQIESNASETLGSEVDLGFLQIRESDAAVDMGGLQLASPVDPLKNLLEADKIVLDLDPVPLAEKKLVLDQFTLSGMRFNTVRKRPARPAPADSPARKLYGETVQWAQRSFQIPQLTLQKFDTLKNLVLDPSQLGTVKAADALVNRADSLKTAFQTELAALQLKPLLDSSTALANRLAKSDPKKLGVAGAAQTAQQIKTSLDRIKQAKAQVLALQKSGEQSVALLGQGLQEVDLARQRDYDFAKGLLQLPTIDAPNISQALFAQQSVDYFQQALYYAQLAQKYLPPGLRPLNRPGPKRFRMKGTTVDFPKEHEYPKFLLRQGNVDFAVTSGSKTGDLKASFAGFTSQPALYGKPATLDATGHLTLGDSPVGVRLGAVLDHLGAVSKDSLSARLENVPIPDITIPGLPFSVLPGKGAAEFAFAMRGDRLAGRWNIRANDARWTADSGKVKSFSLVENTIWRVVSGLSELRVTAELGGTVTQPTLAVSSNLDDAIANQLRALVGEELAKGEVKARAAVDRLVEAKIGPARARVDQFKSQAAELLGLEKNQLDGLQTQLEAQLKRFTGGVTGGIKLPKI